jgi:FKBP-type peptidyl-prolyl cis-trans isomerase FklB
MKLKPLCLSIALTLLAGATLAQTAASAFKTPLEATGYAVGVDMVRNFKAQGVTFDIEQLIHGMRDANSGATLALSDAEVRRLVSGLESDVRSKMAAVRKLEAESNQKAGADYLAANAKKPGVTTTPSGLQYVVLKAGTGRKPTDESSVVANYSGQLIDGSTFDASQPGSPVTFKVGGVIPGWREALKLMPQGSKWQLTIPAALAYGERGAGRSIGPNQTLRFDVELVEVK